jgi:hypothetical protein
MGRNRQRLSSYKKVRVDGDMFGAVSMRAAYVSLKGFACASFAGRGHPRIGCGILRSRSVNLTELLPCFTMRPCKGGVGSLCMAGQPTQKLHTHTHTHEIYSRSMKLHKWPSACHQLGPPGTHGRPRDSFSAGPQNPEEPHPPRNAMRHTAACLSRACLWLGSLLWGEY